ncbi:MAG: DNA repair protein RecN, partial [Acidobacteria bacterium]|nr:DNA repair protein RecN [Acidobacteriota bacterium]
DKAIVSCVFQNDENRTIDRILDENGLETAADSLILKREISSTKSRVWINNQPATVAVLKELAPNLISIHAQNETILAFDPPARLKLLDQFAGIHVEDLARKFAAWRELVGRIAELEKSEQDRLRLVDLWSYQKREINSARLEESEDVRLDAERRILMNAEKLYAAAMSVHDLLYESPQSALSSLHAAARQVEELARLEPKFQETGKSLESARADIEDVATTARDYADAIDASPERLAEVEDRLAAIDKLKRKYGSTVREIIDFGNDLENKLAEVENREEILQSLRKQLAAAADEYLAEARSTSRARALAASKLEKLVEAEINKLAMKARFEVRIESGETQDHWSTSGIDSVAYLIATNPGEPLAPIEKIASGGELSRVMLALKSTVEGAKARTNGNGRAKRTSSERTLVFDEIDTGIGGKAAEAVGRRLKLLGGHNQVLCVTHLPQIASFADHHLVIEKSELRGRTRTQIRALDPKERREEIARMLSGALLTDASLKHAEQMLRANA